MNWIPEYEIFSKSGGKSDNALSKTRIEMGIEFVKCASDDDLMMKIKFLKTKELTEKEIEEVIETTMGPKIALGYMTGELFVANKNSSRGTNVKSNEKRNPLWSVGQQVFAYCGEYIYTLAPIVSINDDRHGDCFQIEFNNQATENQTNRQWLPEGLKGIVADIPPRDAHLLFGVHILYSKSSDSDFTEGTILSCIDSDIYRVENTTGNTIEVHSTQIRTIKHPRSIDDSLGCSNETLYGGKGLVLSQPCFKHSENNTGTATDRHVTSSTVEKDITTSEALHLVSHIRSYGRYPVLDAGISSITGMITFADFVRDYGEKDYGSNEHIIPLHPLSQENCSGVGYGVDLSRHVRSPTNRSCFAFNPILDISQQCLQNNTKFVDPDFPPSRYSLSPDDTMTGDYTWERLGALESYTCVVAAASDPWSLAPGDFTPDWLPHIVSHLPQITEFDDMISPSSVPADYGAYTVRILWDTTWHFVVVDDFVPVRIGNKNDDTRGRSESITEGNTKAFLRSGNAMEVYAALLEKVLAKLLGSYANLRTSKQFKDPCVVWEIFTGGLAERTHYSLLSNTAGWIENLCSRYENRQLCCMLSKSISSDAEIIRKGRVTIDTFVENNLRPSKSYIIQRVEYVEENYYVLVSNPYASHDSGASIQLSASLCSRVSSYKGISDRIKKELETIKTSSGQWMLYSDYMLIMYDLVTCWHFDAFQKVALKGTFENACGGSLFGHEETFFSNNQYLLRVVHNSFVAAQLSLSTCNERLFEGETPRLQLHLFQSTSDDPDVRLPRGSRENQLFTSNTICLVPDDEEVAAHPSVHFTGNLKSGTYVIIPDIGFTDSKETFSLKIWSNANFTVRLL